LGIRGASQAGSYLEVPNPPKRDANWRHGVVVLLVVSLEVASAVVIGDDGRVSGLSMLTRRRMRGWPLGLQTAQAATRSWAQLLDADNLCTQCESVARIRCGGRGAIVVMSIM
jgi:hypothetical protein